MDRIIGTMLILGTGGGVTAIHSQDSSALRSELHGIHEEVGKVTTAIAVMQEGSKLDIIRDQRVKDHEDRLRVLEMEYIRDHPLGH